MLRVLKRASTHMFLWKHSLNNTLQSLLGKLGNYMNIVCVSLMSNTSLLANNEFKGLEQKQLYWKWGSSIGKVEYGINFTKSVIHKSILLNYVITLSWCLPSSLPSPGSPPPPHLLTLPDVLHNSPEPTLLPWSWFVTAYLSSHCSCFFMGFFFFLSQSCLNQFQFPTLQGHTVLAIYKEFWFQLRCWKSCCW